MGQPLIDYFPQYEGSNSVVLAGGTLTIFGAGTTDLVDLFSDIDLKIEIENPTTLDAAGMIPDVYYTDGLSVKIEIRKADGSLFRTKDNLPAFGGPTAGVSVWSSDQVYSKGETVVYLGLQYLSEADKNTGNVPVSASVFWTRSPFQGVWNTNLTYAAADRVIDPATGFLYIARTTTQGDDPSTSPSQWGLGDGIGLQTVNAGSTGFIPGTGAVKSTKTVGNAKIPVATFVDTADNDVQFSFLMPASYDNTQTLQARLTYYTGTLATGTARFIVTAFGLGNDALLTTINFGTVTLGIDLDGRVADTQYITDIFDVNESGTLAPNSQAYFQLLRDTTNDDYDQSVEIKDISLYYKTRSSADDAQS